MTLKFVSSLPKNRSAESFRTAVECGKQMALRMVVLFALFATGLHPAPAFAQPAGTPEASAEANAKTGESRERKATLAPALKAKEKRDLPFILTPAPEISVLTFGPGDAAFLKFGHNAIRVQDSERGTDLVYNFGTFRFDNPLLILDFLTGKFKYWVSVTSFRRTLDYYRQYDRDVIEQTLNLGHQSAHDIARALAENAKPENRYYVYDYYRDNCSTRVRDVIDKGMGGSIERRSKETADMTLRDHTLRAVADDFWLYVGLDIAMGAYIDQKETRYAEMFLPEKLHDGLARIIFTGVHGTAALVRERKVWYKSTGENKLYRRPPERTLDFLKGGLALGGVFGFLGWEAYRRRKVWAKALLSLLLFVHGLATGILGLLFLGLWLFTDHVVAYRNENILQCAPWGILLAICAWGVFRERPKWIHRAFKLTLAGAALAALGLVLKVFPFMGQENARVIALLLPTWFGALFALNLMRLRTQLPLLVPIRISPEEEAAALVEEEPGEESPPSNAPSKRPDASEPDSSEEEEEAAAGAGQPVPA